MGYGKTDVHVSQPLTNFAVSYMQDATSMIADKVMPAVTVSKEADKYFMFDRGNWRARTDTKRAAGSPSAKTTLPKLSTDTYLIEEYSLHEVVPQREIDEADAPLAPLQDATADIMEQLMLGKETAVCSALFTVTAVCSTSVVSIAAAAKWDYTTTTQPIDVVDVGSFAVAQQIGKMANTGICGAAVWKVLKNHDDILDRIKYTQKGIITNDIVASVMDFDNLYVGMAVNMSTDAGITSEATAYIWGKYFLVNYTNPTPRIKGVSHAYQFAKAGSQVKVSNWFDKDLNGNKVEGSVFYDKKIVSSLAAYLMIDPVI